MKKMTLFLISGLLVLLLSGAAMAGQINLDPNPDDTGFYYVEEGQTLDVSLTLGGLVVGQQYTMYLTVDGAGLIGTISGFSDIDLEPVNGGETESFTFTYSGDSSGNINVARGTGADQGSVQIVLTKGTAPIATRNFAAAWMDIIPEFPTIALPIAAILGLVFIFGRKKKEV